MKQQPDSESTQESNREEAKAYEPESNDHNLPETNTNANNEHEVETESPQSDDESANDGPSEDTEPSVSFCTINDFNFLF